MVPVIASERVRDAEQLLKLQYLCYQTEAELYGDWSIPPLTQTLWQLLKEYDTHTIVVARLGEEVVGSVRGRLEDGTCHIGRLTVHPRLQRRGLGTSLMDEIETCFPGAERYELFSTCPLPRMREEARAARLRCWMVGRSSTLAGTSFSKNLL